MVTPFAHDQFDNAARLTKLGVARTADYRSGKHPDPEDLQQEELATNMYLETEHQILPGNSGGPIVNGEGRLIGVISRSSLKDYSYSVPVEYVWRMLRSVEGWENAKPRQ